MDIKACFERKPVARDYTPQGSFQEVNGLKTYVAGPISATKGIILIYDIFGLANQTIQGADLLASHLSATVFIPDIFKGNALVVGDAAMTPEKRKEWMASTADLANGLKTTLSFRAAAGRMFPSVEKWGIFGLCWGGKIAVLSTAKENNADSGFVVSGQAHGARFEAIDAENLNTPHINLASKDEPEDVIQAYTTVFSREGRVLEGQMETFKNMFHGWMGARANLEDAENYKEYERGYELVASFFDRHL